MDSLFFIDTGAGGQDEHVDKENDNESEPEEVDEDKVMGARDVASEAKLRNRAIKERSLASFLFGKPKDDEVKSDYDSGEDDKDAPADDESDSDEDKDREDNENDEGIDEEVSLSCVQPTLPSDLLLSSKRKRKAAWEDEDDPAVLVKDVTATYKKAVGAHGEQEGSREQYSKHVARKFKSVVGQPAWASLDRAEDEDSDDEFFRETTDVVERGAKSEHLQQGFLQFRKIKDMNYWSHREGAVISCTEFHPNSTVALVAGNNGTVTLSQIDGKDNPKIQSINFNNFPIKTGKFSAGGNEFIIGSKFHPHFFVYDMIAGQSTQVPWRNKSSEHNTAKFDISPDGKLLAFIGRFGYIHLVSSMSKEVVKSMKMNDWCQNVRFSRDGCHLYSVGEGGEVYIWDTRSQDCLAKFQDEGCVVGTAVDVSSHHLATGSSSGVVNIYSSNNHQLFKIKIMIIIILSASRLTESTQPKPDKAILNLTTQIDHLRFNNNGEMLAMSSMNKVRLWFYVMYFLP